MFERVEYTVARIDGDYAYLQRVDDPSAEEKCVAKSVASGRDQRRLPRGI